jgi:hypothetical protein
MKDHADRQSRLDRNGRISALAGARQASSAASESHTVKSPRFWRPASYSAQFRTPYRDFVYLYWLRFAYFIYLDSGKGNSSQ